MMEAISDDAAEKAVNIIDVADKLLNKISEIVEVFPIESVASTQALKHLTSALKDLREIKGIKSDADMREQEARIRNLEKQVNEDRADNHVVITFDSALSKYSK
jgi:hypothetical protein